jgi:hypothetical protein
VLSIISGCKRPKHFGGWICFQFLVEQGVGFLERYSLNHWIPSFTLKHLGFLELEVVDYVQNLIHNQKDTDCV